MTAGSGCKGPSVGRSLAIVRDRSPKVAEDKGVAPVDITERKRSSGK